MTLYVPERRFVPISDTAANEYNGTIYYYVNYQWKQTDGASGIYNDVRSALYLTESEINDFYELYKNIVIYSLGRFASSNEGMKLLDFNTWKQLYVSKEKYRELREGEHWTFLGWYKTPEGGTEESMPYNVGDPVTGPFKLTAHWRLDSGFAIQYVPQYTMPDGAVINGQMTDWRDPPQETLTYADNAKTEIYKDPTGLTRTKDGVTEEITDNAVIFRGWALVYAVLDSEGNVVRYIPAESTNGQYDKITTYYYPSDPYTVHAANASSNNKIYFQAIYQYRDSSDRRPWVANLILDANKDEGGYVSAGYEGHDPKLPKWDIYPGESSVNTDSELDAQGKPTQIEFGDIQASAAVHLYRYATDKDAIAAADDGYNYFKNTEGHFLLGFDPKSDPDSIVWVDPHDDSITGAAQPYVPNYPADSVIAITRNDARTLYAIWEPMVYLQIKNKTGVTDHPVTFTISQVDGSSGALDVINVKEGMYKRTPLTSLEITLQKDEEITLAFPKGAEKSIKISGVNELGTGNTLLWNTSLELVGADGTTIGTYDTAAEAPAYSYSHETSALGTHPHDLAHGNADNTQSFDFTETLIVNKEPLVVTFTMQQKAFALLLDDNYPVASGQTGGVSEKDFSKEEVLTEAAPKTYDLPSANTCLGYNFLGWAHEKDADTAVYSAGNWTISNLQDFFEVDLTDRVYTYPNGDTVVRKLYAVWAPNSESNTVTIYKEVPEPGDRTKPFKFKVTISARYKPVRQSRSNCKRR